MKGFHPFRRVTYTLIVIALLLVAWHGQAQEMAPLEVKSAAISRDVIAREPVGAGSSFPFTVGKLYCYTKIVNVPGPTEILHVWYYGTTERARVSLSVNSPSWRTYSSKIIQPHEIGEWHVEILSPSGKRLTSVAFDIIQ
jgi:hypothetical protein